jgi:hypothetical protein
MSEAKSGVFGYAVSGSKREDSMPRRSRATLDWMRARLDEALRDSRPNIPAKKVFKRLREYHGGQSRRGASSKTTGNQ